MSLLKKYEKILASMDTYVGPDDVLQSVRGKTENVIVNYRSPGTDKIGKFPLKFPSDAVIKRGEDFSSIVFNPLGETYLKKEMSEVQKVLIYQASASTMMRVTQVIMGLVDIIIDTSRHEDLPEDLFNLVRGITPPKDTKAAEKMSKYMTSIMNKHSGVKGTKALCRYRQQANVRDGDKMYIRTTSLIFPFLEKIMREDKPAGVNPPNKGCVAMAKTIAERVLTDLDIVSLWEGRESPYFMSLLECHAEVIKRLNKLAKLLGIDLGKDFKASWWSAKAEEELVELRKEIPIRFIGNEGGAVSEDQARGLVTETEPKQSPVAAAVKQATTPAPKVIESAAPAPTPTTQAPQEKPKGPVRLGDLNNMAISNRSTSNLVASQAPAAEYVSPFAGKSNAAPTAQTPAAAASTQSTGGLVIESPSASAPGNGLVVEEQMVHFHDANNHPLYLRSGHPYMVPASAINPAEKYLQATDNNKALKYNADGVPVLRKANLAPGQMGAPGMIPGQPAANFYNGVAQTAQVNPANPNTFYAAANTQTAPGFGNSAMVGANGMVPQQQPQTQIILLNHLGQQVQAQFDMAGNALAQYWTSNGQQVTHYNQIAHLVQAQAANTVPPVGGFNPGVAVGHQPSGIGKHF